MELSLERTYPLYDIGQNPFIHPAIETAFVKVTNNLRVAGSSGHFPCNLTSPIIVIEHKWSLVRSGLGAAESHCLNLSGTCRRDICKVTEDEIGGCRRRWKCCRLWWILLPIPTPVIFSDYQEPIKPRLK
ncbi:beta-defensin 109-like [Lepus europaeus]|uniref:beta-defensin 109-like n=1 Tax=Lepus europaeus TaxID=9983 RepID=UPI002B471E3D|nr:beta-defensin 109-like [Lepus europaeus]